MNCKNFESELSQLNERCDHLDYVNDYKKEQIHSLEIVVIRQSSKIIELEEIIRDHKLLYKEQIKVLEAQNKEIIQIKQKMDEQYNDLYGKHFGVYQAVYEIIKGIYNHDTQRYVSERLLSILNGVFPTNIHKYLWGSNNPKNWPTTRQGDKNEEKINKLEKMVEQVIEKLDITNNISSLSSLSSYSSSPEIEERKSISSSLCGNE
jgi:hypothetical protein